MFAFLRFSLCTFVCRSSKLGTSGKGLDLNLAMEIRGFTLRPSTYLCSENKFTEHASACNSDSVSYGTGIPTSKARLLMQWIFPLIFLNSVSYSSLFVFLNISTYNWYNLFLTIHPVAPEPLPSMLYAQNDVCERDSNDLQYNHKNLPSGNSRPLLSWVYNTLNPHALISETIDITFQLWWARFCLTHGLKAKYHSIPCFSMFCSIKQNMTKYTCSSDTQKLPPKCIT